MKPYKIIHILVFSFLAVTIIAPGSLLMGANELTEVKNIPNPFSPSIETTLIRYNLSADCKVTITIYNLIGDMVRQYDDTECPGTSGGS